MILCLWPESVRIKIKLAEMFSGDVVLEKRVSCELPLLSKANMSCHHMAWTAALATIIV
jgi:hypothetical protein